MAPWPCGLVKLESHFWPVPSFVKMPLHDLPSLCVDKIIRLLMVQSSRRRCDIVRDCIVLCATSRETRLWVGLPASLVLDPVVKPWHPRHPGCGLGIATCVQANNESLVRACARSHTRSRIRRAEACRKSCLVQALHARGCSLGTESKESAAFIRGDAGTSLRDTVHHAEEMQFFLDHTQYLRILASSSEAADVVYAKEEALRLWRSYHPEHLHLLPRTLLCKPPLVGI